MRPSSRGGPGWTNAFRRNLGPGSRRPMVMTTAHLQPLEPLELPARLTAPPRLTQRHPWLLPAAMAVHRTRRRTRWVRDTWSGRVVWASRRDERDLPVRLQQHGSLLLRELDADQM